MKAKQEKDIKRKSQREDPIEKLWKKMYHLIQKAFNLLISLKPSPSPYC